jgi:hypothetical protein
MIDNKDKSAKDNLGLESLDDDNMDSVSGGTGGQHTPEEVEKAVHDLFGKAKRLKERTTPTTSTTKITKL